MAVVIPTNYVPEAPVLLVKPTGRVRGFGGGATTNTARGAALLAAVAAAGVDDVIRVGAGTFQLNAAIALTSDGVTVQGSGPATILDFATDLVGSMSIRLYADRLTVGGFTLLANGTSGSPGLAGIGYLTTEAGYPASHAATDFLIHDVSVSSAADQIMFWPDATAFTGAIKRCLFNQGLGSDPTIHLMGAAGADILFEGCEVRATTASDVALIIEGTGGTCRVKDSRLVGMLSNEAATTLRVQNVSYDPVLASGVITPENVPISRTITIVITPPGTATSIGDGQAFFIVPPEFDGGEITSVFLATPVAGTTNLTNVDLRRVRGGVTVDVLSANLTIDSTELTSATAATPAVINTSNDDLSTGDILWVDVDAVHTTPAEGLQLTIGVSP